MLYGIVTSTGRGDGYAFAQVTGDQRGYFIHATHVASPLVMGALRVGDHIMFDVRMTAKRAVRDRGPARARDRGHRVAVRRARLCVCGAR
jgi:hypothetical protein